MRVRGLVTDRLWGLGPGAASHLVGWPLVGWLVAARDLLRTDLTQG